MKFVERSHHLRQPGRKLKRLYSLLHVFTHTFFRSDRNFHFFFKLKRIICTLLLCSKSRSPCSFKLKEKEHFVVDLSLREISFVVYWGARAHLRVPMTQQSCTVGNGNAIMRNHLKFRNFKIVVCCRGNVIKSRRNNERL